MPRKKTAAIVIHCSATRANQPFDVEAIRRMHKARGFSDIGYHYVIGLKGETWTGRIPDNSIGSHVKGFNHNTLGICYIGGLRAKDGKPEDTRTPAQIKAMRSLIALLLVKYPDAVVLGHRDLSPDKNKDGTIQPTEWLKSCPCFNAGPWARSVGLPGGKFTRGVFVKL